MSQSRRLKRYISSCRVRPVADPRRAPDAGPRGARSSDRRWDVDQEKAYALTVFGMYATPLFASVLFLAIRNWARRKAAFAVIRADLAEVRAAHTRLPQPRPALPSLGEPGGPDPAVPACGVPPDQAGTARGGADRASDNVSPTAPKTAGAARQELAQQLCAAPAPRGTAKDLGLTPSRRRAPITSPAA